ncbi:MAG: hypothetical protein K0U59_05405 [Gammaproteobacteria bacterium]|nr:hypothetical protein [Gammaproteobacteria bacterium]
MLEITCKSLQTVHLGEIFAVTPVWMEDGSIRLYIVARDGGELTINEQAPRVANAVGLQEAQQDESPGDSQPPNPPGDDSDLQHRKGE